MAERSTRLQACGAGTIGPQHRARRPCPTVAKDETMPGCDPSDRAVGARDRREDEMTDQLMDVNGFLDVVVDILRRIAPEVEPGQLDPAVDLREQIDFDSMDFLTFVDSLHEATGVEIAERDYPAVATIAGCVRYLTQRSGSPSSARHPR
jgi:acyl carrier protein